MTLKGREGYRVYRRKRGGGQNYWPQEGTFTGGLEGAVKEALEAQPLQGDFETIISVLDDGNGGGLAIFTVESPPAPTLVIKKERADA